MNQLKDLTGMRFGRLRVMERAIRNCPDGRPTWLCYCDCGIEIVVRGKSLKRGYTKSCGCLFRELLLDRITTHGMTKMPEYRIWKSMNQRCYNESSSHYDYYGGRGIIVCDSWRDSFVNFYNDMGSRPSSKHSIDRLVNDGNYEPSNCKWSTNEEQVRNRGLLRNNPTGYNGVYSKGKRWVASIGVHNKTKHVGTFDDIEEAVRARKQAEIDYWN